MTDVRLEPMTEDQYKVGFAETGRNMAKDLRPGCVAAWVARPAESAWRSGPIKLVFEERVSELTSLTCRDAELGTGAHLRCTGKAANNVAPH